MDDPRARYVNEPGLYRLIARSTMEKAECFQDSTDKAADSGRGKEAQSRHGITKQKAAKGAAGRAAQGNSM